MKQKLSEGVTLYINHTWIAEKIKLSCLALKVSKSQCESITQYAHVTSKICAWKQSGIDWNMESEQSSLAPLDLPLTHLGFKSNYRSIHVCDQMVLPLKLEV